MWYSSHASLLPPQILTACGQPISARESSSRRRRQHPPTTTTATTTTLKPSRSTPRRRRKQPRPSTPNPTSDDEEQEETHPTVRRDAAATMQQAEAGIGARRVLEFARGDAALRESAAAVSGGTAESWVSGGGGGDEEGLSLLRQQLSAVQRIRIEHERKDATIAALRLEARPFLLVPPAHPRGWSLHLAAVGNSSFQCFFLCCNPSLFILLQRCCI